MRFKRSAHRSDANEQEIVEALRRAGYYVERLGSVGRGVPDLLVADKDRIVLLEVKMPNGKLTEDQESWHAKFPRRVAIVHTPTEAIQAMM